MISQRGHVTLVDFGFSKRIGTPRSQTFTGTIEYSAPECILSDGATPSDCTQAAADIYALGVILWQLSRQELDASQSRTEIAKLIECDGPVEHLILEMTSSDPEKRPTAKEIKDRLLRLEIESLGQHIRPARRAA